MAATELRASRSRISNSSSLNGAGGARHRQHAEQPRPEHQRHMGGGHRLREGGRGTCLGHLDHLGGVDRRHVGAGWGAGRLPEFAAGQHPEHHGAAGVHRRQRVLGQVAEHLLGLQRAGHVGGRALEHQLDPRARGLLPDPAGPLVGQRGQVGHDRHVAQVLPGQRAAGVERGDLQRADDPAQRVTYGAGDQRRPRERAPEVRAGLRARPVELPSQRRRRLPVLDAGQEERPPTLDRRLGEPGIGARVGTLQDVGHDLGQYGRGEPRHRRDHAPPAFVNGHEHPAVHARVAAQVIGHQVEGVGAGAVGGARQPR